MPISVDHSKGAVFYLDDAGSWQPAQTAVNPQTKETFAFDGKGWQSVPAPGLMDRITSAAKSVGVKPPEGDLSLSDVVTGAVRNAPASAVQFAQDIVHPVLHPIDTAEAIKNIGHGLLQKVGILGGEDKEKYADAVGKHFYDRYGSSEGIKKAIATDPVGVLSDVALVLTGGGAAVAKAGGVVGKVGEVVNKVGNVIDPINAVGAGVKATGRVAAEVVGGFGTHTGGQSLVDAARSGAEGGKAGESFREHMRAIAPVDEIVTDSRAAVAKLREDRGNVYRTEMAKIGQDTTVLDFGKIDQAITAVEKVKTYKGQDLSPTTRDIRTQIAKEVEDWKKLDPKEFHTAEGLDALKQKIGDIMDGTKPHTPERIVAEKAYHGIRDTIIKQAPDYAKVMKGYEEASALIKEIEKTLSLDKKANIDTSVRKLQSVLRNNVNANYGKRAELADFLVSAGAEHLLTKLAGQALNAWMPRGLGKVVGGATLATGGGGFFAGIGIPTLATAAPALALMSPRLMGEAAHKLGQASRVAPQTGRAAYQAGRATRQQP